MKCLVRLLFCTHAVTFLNLYRKPDLIQTNILVNSSMTIQERRLLYLLPLNNFSIVLDYDKPGSLKCCYALKLN